MDLRVFESPDEVWRAAARAIRERVLRLERTVIAVSGGTTPRALYEILGGGEDRKALSGRGVVWALVDERCVPPDDPRSNGGMVRSTLLRDGLSPRHELLDFDRPEIDPEASARNFESRWRAAGIAALDVAILGIGDDGHTASLFPGTPVLDVADRIAAAVFVPRLGEWRVTLTLPVLRRASVRIVLATGSSKAAVMRDVVAGADLPIVRSTSGAEGETIWLADALAVPAR